jgi:hypothetical protein
MRVPSRNISLHLRYLDLNIALMSEGSSWSPDVADDMVARMENYFENTIRTMVEYGMFESSIEGEGNDEDEDEDEDEWGPQPEKELIDPRIVTLEGEDG